MCDVLVMCPLSHPCLFPKGGETHLWRPAPAAIGSVKFGMAEEQGSPISTTAINIIALINHEHKFCTTPGVRRARTQSASVNSPLAPPSPGVRFGAGTNPTCVSSTSGLPGKSSLWQPVQEADARLPPRFVLICVPVVAAFYLNPSGFSNLYAKMDIIASCSNR